jgi:hypothetical protein
MVMLRIQRGTLAAGLPERAERAIMATSITAPRTTDIRLLAYENATAAQVATLVVGYDDEGWETFATFKTGQIVADGAGHLYKVIGFTTDDEVIVVQYGLEMDRAISSVDFLPAGLTGVEAPICGF